MATNTNMPKFDLEQVKSVLTEEEYKLFSLCLNKEYLRASKPNEKKCKGDFGKAYYIWRLTAFYLAGFAPHNCMPFMLDAYIHQSLEIDGIEYWDTKYGTPEREKFKELEREITQQCEAIVNKVVDSQPLSSKRGIVQWGRALGYL